MSEAHPPVCDYEGSDYQERFWDQGGRAYEDRVEAVALQRLLPRGGDLLLEVGAGAGRNTARYDGFRRVVLLDYSRTQLERAQSRLGRSDRHLYVVADVYRLPFAPGLFDAATMIRVLHHMVDPLGSLRQVREVLQTGGAFILEYANKQNLKAVARWLLRRQRWNPFSQEAVEFAPLNYNFHPAAVRRWLSAAGFATQRQLSVSHFRVGLLKGAVPLGLLVWLDSMAQWTGVWWQLSPSVFVRARAVGSARNARPGAFWRCPACRSVELVSLDAGLQCAACGRLWPLRDGIYELKVPA